MFQAHVLPCRYAYQPPSQCGNTDRHRQTVGVYRTLLQPYSRYGHAELLQLRYGQGRKSGKRARSRGLHAAQLSRPCHRRRNAGELCHEPRTARCQVSVYPSERKGCEYAYLPEPELRQLRIQTVAVDGYGLRTHRPDTDGTEQAYPLYRF